MKAIHLSCVLFVALTLASASTAQEGLSLKIDKITQDDAISGTISGLMRKGTANHKVVVYVKTDQWYVHPYAQGGKGKSWAPIASDGSWQIETVRRQFAAASVAAVLVEMNVKVPTKVVNVRAISSRKAIIVHSLEGTPDYGKL